MTALDKAQIPNQINTLERLNAWSALVLGKITPTKAVIENAGENPERMMQTFLVRADDGQEYLINRTVLPLNPDWRANNTDAFWLMINDVADVDIPVAYTNG